MRNKRKKRNKPPMSDLISLLSLISQPTCAFGSGPAGVTPDGSMAGAMPSGVETGRDLSPGVAICPLPNHQVSRCVCISFSCARHRSVGARRTPSRSSPTDAERRNDATTKLQDPLRVAWAQSLGKQRINERESRKSAWGTVFRRCWGDLQTRGTRAFVRCSGHFCMSLHGPGRRLRARCLDEPYAPQATPRGRPSY